MSYGKLTVNDGKEMGGTTSHNRTLSRGATRSETAYFGAGKKSLLYDSCISRPPNFEVKILS